jgi:hypothetical protein
MGDHESDSLGRKHSAQCKAKWIMLTAPGIWEDGHREILAWQLGAGKDAES